MLIALSEADCEERVTIKVTQEHIDQGKCASLDKKPIAMRLYVDGDKNAK